MLSIDRNSRNVIFGSYSRQDGLQDCALIPAVFHEFDGSASWLEDGQEKSVARLSEVAKQDARKAVFTSVETELGDAIVESSVRQFLSHREEIDPAAKCLVLASDQSHARKIQQLIKKKFSVDFKVATSDEGKEAQKRLHNFRNDPSEIGLITVAMSYIGLDVPAISHLAIVTRIRSKPWLEQAFGRATRYNTIGIPYENQIANIFVPSDPLMKAVIDKIRADQDAVLRKRDERKKTGRGGSNRKSVIPVQSSVSSTSIFDFDSGEPVSLKNLRDLLEQEGIPISTDQWERLTDRYTQKPEITVQPITLKQKVESLRRNIEATSRKIALLIDVEPEEVNRQIKHRFSKSRRDMTLDELITTFDYVDSWHKSLGGDSQGF